MSTWNAQRSIVANTLTHILDVFACALYVQLSARLVMLQVRLFNQLTSMASPLIAHSELLNLK